MSDLLFLYSKLLIFAREGVLRGCLPILLLLICSLLLFLKLADLFLLLIDLLLEEFGFFFCEIQHLRVVDEAMLLQLSLEHCILSFQLLNATSSKQVLLACHRAPHVSKHGLVALWI